MPDKEVVLYGSADAARYVTGISGWVDRNGMFYGDNKDSEHLARYSGCTHRICECGKQMEKHYTKCSSCRENAAVERHRNRERKEWDGSRPIYSEACDRYFHSWDDVEDYLEDCKSCTKEDLRLLICRPVYLGKIDEDWWADDLPDEGELPDAVMAALNALNEAIDKAGEVAWEPGKFAVDL